MSRRLSPTNQSQDDTVISMRSRGKKRPSHIPMIHIENESMMLRQRPRANTGDSLVKPNNNNGVNLICDKLNEAFITPPNQRLNDSGFHGDSPATVHSDPDWYLRPRKLSRDLSNTDSKRKGSQEETRWSKTRRWFGLGGNRKTFLDNRSRSSSSKMFSSVSMETLLGSLIFVILVASLLFSLLISIRFFEPREMSKLNGKYQSLLFATEQRVAQQQPEVQVVMPRKPVATDPANHIPREELKDDAEEFLDYEDPSTFRGKEGSNDAEVKPRVDVAANIESVKKAKAKKTKHRNPLKPKKTTSTVKRKTKEMLDESQIVPDAITNDYDDPPSNFRGKQPEVVDLLNDL